MKKFSFTKCGSSRYFYQVLWQFLSSRRSRLIFGGLLVAAFGGEMRLNYFQNRTPEKSPAKAGDFLARPAELVRHPPDAPRILGRTLINPWSPVQSAP